MAGQHRSNVKELTRDILDILWEQTDKEHPISIKKLTDLLEQRCDAKPDRATVTSILDTLRKHPCGPGQVKCRESEKENGDPYTYGYYMERDITAEEVEMLVSDVMFSRMRTRKQAEALIKKLKGLVGADKRKELEYSCVLPYSLYTANALVQKNIAMVQRVISGNLHRRKKETVVSFRFNGYGADKALREIPGGKYENFLPLKIVEAYGSYYMVGLMDRGSTSWNFRLDLVTRLAPAERSRQRTDRRERAIQKFDDPNELSRYLTEHLYMAYETKGDKPTAVYLRVERIPWKPEASMTIVHDAFGHNYTVMDDKNETYVDIRVTGVLWGITSFVRQNMDRVKVIGPEKVKERVDAALRKDFAKYFAAEQEI